MHAGVPCIVLFFLLLCCSYLLVLWLKLHGFLTLFYGSDSHPSLILWHQSQFGIKIGNLHVLEVENRCVYFLAAIYGSTSL